MKTINIKGKEYVTVNERLKEFRSTHKDYCLVTDIIELGADFATVKATIIDDKGNVRATGFAREVVAKSPINKYAFLENCETSAIGRCLGNFGIGIDEAVCTADELIQKLSYEEPKEKTAFEKDATAEKRATTNAIKKAIKTDTPYIEPQPKNDLETRYKNALIWLNNFEDCVWSPTPAQRDSLNKLLDDLKSENEIKKFYEIQEIVNRKDKINDSINY
jgi:hypothetical protein